MKEYLHGLYQEENDTVYIDPRKSKTLQVVVGTAPINLTTNLSVNEPVLLHNFPEAIEKLGYSKDFDKFSLCQSMDASFKVFGVAPIVMINVLDPATHKTDVADKVANVVEKSVVEAVEGILLDTVKVKENAGIILYIKDTDYTIGFNDDGHVKIDLLTAGDATAEVTLKLEYSHLDPTKVTEADLIGAYTEATNTYTGIQMIKQIYPRLNLVPSIITAPGHSYKPAVARALEAVSRKLNGNYNAIVLNDLETSEIDRAKVIKWKTDNGYTSKASIALYPKLKVINQTFSYSAMLAAAIQELDIDQDDVPCKSPSNKPLPITAAVLDDGTEIYMDQGQANVLNAAGIVTALNIGGWKIWGNNTAAFPDITDEKERFIMVRRMFDYVGNEFVNEFSSEVDDPTNYRLIESVVDDFNLVLNSLQAQEKIISGSIVFRTDDNPTAEILDGNIKFYTKLAANIPGKSLTNLLEFDPTGLLNSIGGN